MRTKARTTRQFVGVGVAGATVALAVLTAACTAPPITTATGPGTAPGAAPPSASAPASATRPTTPLATSGSALVATDLGLASVPIGSTTPTWTVVGAAAPDGSAVFATTPNGEFTTVTQHDVRTGAAQQTFGVRGDVRVAAVAPGGKWVALTTRPLPATAHIVGYDAPAAPKLDGNQTRLLVIGMTPESGRYDDLVLQGDVEAEAFSPAGDLVYTLRHEQGGYRIQTVDIASKTQQPTFGRLKVEGKDMHGRAVATVLNVDRTILSTLYLNPANAQQPAFVHVLDLKNNWAHCADLPATTPSGGVGWDTITMTPAGTALVGDAAAGKVAEIQVAAVHDPEGKVTVDVRNDPAPPGLPVGLREVPGFRRLVALVP